MKASDVKKELKKYINKQKAEKYKSFFKTAKGDYGEGDIFLGVVVPDQRKVAKIYKDLPIDEIEILLHDPIHECRFTALVILINCFEKASESEKETYVNLYMYNYTQVNNWDLVDVSAPKILGPWFYDKERKTLYEWAKSGHLWKERIAIMSTFYFIKKNDYKDALAIADILLNHDHDLIHKAVGWMIREIGNRDLDIEINFLKNRYKKMPRTMLRYAIEKFPEKLRKSYLHGEI